ncbi:hypothetical protein [Streptomyces sp. NPDC007991]|uniref:hypothetical protein n=1 Tax=Streptomyces sp. NPDC007991 TaxID=3364803 RepID=UPI0036EBF62E
MKIGSTRRRAIVTVIAGALGIAAIGVIVDAAEEMSHHSASSSVSQNAGGRATLADYEPEFATWDK